MLIVGQTLQKLLLKVSDLTSQNGIPAVFPTSSLKEVIVEMTSKRLGVTAVITQDKKIIGIITDGDLRRMLNNHPNPNGVTAEEIMTLQPKTIGINNKAVEALELMRSNSISQLLVINDNGHYQGVIHIHDLIREGLI